MTSSQMRTFGLHLVTFAGGIAAALSFMASKSVDLYAAWDHLHAATQNLIAAWGLIAPIASAAWGIYKATTKNKLIDVVSDPKAPEVAKAIPPTPQVVAVANALKSNGGT